MRVIALAAALGLSAGLLADSQAPASRQISWGDVAPLHTRLEAHGVTAGSFRALVGKTHADSLRRVREGDLDHLVFYLLQSRHFTELPAIEPALSARAFVEGLDEPERKAFLSGAAAPLSRIPDSVLARAAALAEALGAPSPDPRLTYFRQLVVDAALTAAEPSRAARTQVLLSNYLRAMRFVYEKEFVAQRAGPDAVADLYRTRGLSTDTAVEAGYVVYNGLGMVRALDPERRIRKVLIVGPGLDLAPRTGLLEAGPPESYQPWAVMDALLALGLSSVDDLQVMGADINPRVVQHLARPRAAAPVLTLVTDIGESQSVVLSAEYREYFAQLGGAIGTTTPAAAQRRGAASHLRKTVTVGTKPAAALTAARLDIVSERLSDGAFDLVVVTNVLPYFDDVQLMLALSNIAGMLAPGGVFLHNEARPLLQEVTAALGLPLEHSRHAVIATVRGAPPLSDSVWLHRQRVGRTNGVAKTR